MGAEDYHINELRLEWDGWHVADLTQLTGAPLPYPPDLDDRGNPAPYVRSDGINAVVYTGDDNHIYELRLERDGWHAADLSAGG